MRSLFINFMPTAFVAKPCHGSRLFLVVGHRLLSSRGGCSEEVTVTSGVPQGSFLGPILFLAYINDLPEKVKSQVRLFADGTAAYLAITKPTESKQLQDEIDTLQEWELDWNMEFNPGKC